MFYFAAKCLQIKTNLKVVPLLPSYLKKSKTKQELLKSIFHFNKHDFKK